MNAKNAVGFCLALAVGAGLGITLMNRKGKEAPPAAVALDQIPQVTATIIAPEPAPGKGERISARLDIPYTDSGNPRHKLDSYQPQIAGYHHVVVFVHGGSWRSGDKAIYAGIGRWLAANGIGCVIPNYRLHPEVKIDGMMEDLAKVVEWTCDNPAVVGGRPSMIHLMGHSSGAHMVSLLTADETYLQREGLTIDPTIRSTVLLSGIYNLGFAFSLSGTDDAFKGVNRKEYSPYKLVSEKVPPTLVMYAENDYRTLGGQADDFYKKLVSKGVKSELYMVPKEDHVSEIMNLVVPTSPQGQRVLQWIKKH